MKVSYIYIITNGQDIKVGVSKDPENRLKQLQTGSSTELKILEVYPVPKSKAYNIEKQCHDRIKTKWVKRGEWFKDPLYFDIRCTVEEICEKYLV